MATTDALKSLYSQLSSGLNPAPPANDPYVLTSALAPAIASAINPALTTKFDAQLPASGIFLSRPALGKTRERVSLLDFIDPSLHDSIRDGSIPITVDLSTQLAAAANYAKNPYTRLVIPSGVYPYKVSPNWAGDFVRVVCEGEVRFRYTGTGNAVIIDSGAVTGSGSSLVIPSGKANMDFCSSNPLIVECPSTALNGVYLRALHHSRLAFNVKGAGSSSAALYNEFGVCTDIKLIASNNETWYLGSKPYIGFILTNRPGNPNDLSSSASITLDCPIIEGVTIGGQIISGLNVRILGGTIEGCTGAGLDIQAGSTKTFVGETDFEANAGFDIRDNGINTTLSGVQSLAQDLSGAATSGIIVGATSQSLQVERGMINIIQSVAGAKNAVLDRIRYNLYGNGSITDPADAFLIRSAFNCITGKTHDSLPLRTVLSGLPASATSGSPYQYNNTSRVPVTVLFSGGTITQMFFYSTAGVSDGINTVSVVKLKPGEGIWVAYTAAPTITVVR